MVRSTGQIFQDDMGGFVLRMYSTTFLRLQEIGEGFDCCEPGSKGYYKARRNYYISVGGYLKNYTGRTTSVHSGV